MNAGSHEQDGHRREGRQVPVGVHGRQEEDPIDEVGADEGDDRRPGVLPEPVDDPDDREDDDETGDQEQHRRSDGRADREGVLEERRKGAQHHRTCAPICVDTHSAQAPRDEPVGTDVKAMALATIVWGTGEP